MHSTVHQDPAALKDNPGRFSVGTLTYTKAGLAVLFAYLLRREWERHGGLEKYQPPAV